MSAGIKSPLGGGAAIIRVDGDDVLEVTDTGLYHHGQNLVPGYRFIGRVIYHATGTFEKASYPGLRGIGVHVTGAGGAGGGAPSTGAGQGAVGGGGAGGGYGYKFLDTTIIDAMPASVDVEIGEGGAGSSGGTGDTGGPSWFVFTSGGDRVEAPGGFGGGAGALRTTFPAYSGNGQVSGVNFFNVDHFGYGETGQNGYMLRLGQHGVLPGRGGAPAGPWGSKRVGDTVPTSAIGNNGGSAPFGAGAGGGGGFNYANQGLQRSGGSGGDGIVVLDLYA